MILKDYLVVVNDMNLYKFPKLRLCMVHHEDTQDLEQRLEGDSLESTSAASKTVGVDVGGNITYSLIVGIVLDISAGLNIWGILASRSSATAMNAVTGGPYGWWREKTCDVTRTKKDSGVVRKTVADLLAFNTFQVPVYAAAISVGSLVSEGKVDLQKVQDGSMYLAAISPLIGPSMGWYMDKFRGAFGVKSAAEGAYAGKDVVDAGDFPN